MNSIEFAKRINDLSKEKTLHDLVVFMGYQVCSNPSSISQLATDFLEAVELMKNLEAPREEYCNGFEEIFNFVEKLK